jgi:hypothetical protein
LDIFRMESGAGFHWNHGTLARRPRPCQRQ